MLSTCKSQLLGMYYLATLPQRQRAAARRCHQSQVPVMALFYHRVADTYPNDWTISTDRFCKQIRWLQRRFEIVSLETAQQRIDAGVNDRPTVCITFDDGYADNCEMAIPWLIEQGIPFTYFISTYYMQRGEPFPHDLANGQRLLPNSIGQLQNMAAAGVEIGAHTRTHADLGAIHCEKKLREEIIASKEDLEDSLGQSVRYFAFPYGMPKNLSTAAFRIAYEAPFLGVCTAFGGYNAPAGDSFHLRRIHGYPEWSRFCNWLTMDPRKLHTGDLFHPGNYRNSKDS
ncbi:MAG: polysaccharide deacetylase family protein [Pirellulales bacterium]